MLFSFNTIKRIIYSDKTFLYIDEMPLFLALCHLSCQFDAQKIRPFEIDWQRQGEITLLPTFIKQAVTICGTCATKKKS